MTKPYAEPDSWPGLDRVPVCRLSYLGWGKPEWLTNHSLKSAKRFFRSCIPTIVLLLSGCLSTKCIRRFYLPTNPSYSG